MNIKKGKPVAASAIHDQSYEIFPNDLNSNNTAFGGRIMEMADRVAATSAKRHSERVCSTILVDSMRFREPTLRGEVLIFKASVNRAWGTSMEIGIKVMAQNFKTGKEKRVVSAFFTFVALDDNNKPTAVAPIIPQTEDEKRRYEEADMRRKERLSKKR